LVTNKTGGSPKCNFIHQKLQRDENASIYGSTDCVIIYTAQPLQNSRGTIAGSGFGHMGAVFAAKNEKFKTMATQLSNKKVAILVANGFEEVELTKPLEALKNAGANVEIVSPESGKVRAWAETDWGRDYPVDKPLGNSKSQDYDALVLPGGVMNPDKLRTNKEAVKFVKDFMDAGKPVAAICHGPWTLIETGELQGRRMTSYPSLKTDLENAGVAWEDAEVVTDNGLVTSRNPQDLPAFCDKMLEEIAEGAHAA
jgi:protease I